MPLTSSPGFLEEGPYFFPLAFLLMFQTESFLFPGDTEAQEGAYPSSVDPDLLSHQSPEGTTANLQATYRTTFPGGPGFPQYSRPAYGGR